jgi:hypothetical protein
LLLLACTSSAQLDSNFVETFASLARANGGLRFRDNSASFSVNDREELRLSNQDLALRIGGRYKWLGYTFSIPISDLGTGTELGDARSLGANIQFYRDKFYLNFNGRRTRGFVQERPQMDAVFRPDMQFINALAFGFRILNSKQFSLRSSFKQRNRQLQSSGSFLLGGVLARQILTADSLVVPFRKMGTVKIDRFVQTKVGVGLGYAYTHVWGSGFFATPLLILGPEGRFIGYDPISSEREIERFRVSVRLRGRLAVGYNGRQNYLALTGAYLPSIDGTENLNTRVDETQIELVIGHRFGVD